MTRIFVKPRAGRVVPLPDGSGDLPLAGKTVSRTGYWTRRERDGDIDVSTIEPPAPVAQPDVAVTTAPAAGVDAASPTAADSAKTATPRTRAAK